MTDIMTFAVIFADHTLDMLVTLASLCVDAGLKAWFEDDGPDNGNTDVIKHAEHFASHTTRHQQCDQHHALEQQPQQLDNSQHLEAWQAAAADCSGDDHDAMRVHAHNQQQGDQHINPCADFQQQCTSQHEGSFGSCARYQQLALCQREMGADLACLTEEQYEQCCIPQQPFIQQQHLDECALYAHNSFSAYSQPGNHNEQDYMQCQTPEQQHWESQVADQADCDPQSDTGDQCAHHCFDSLCC